MALSSAASSTLVVGATGATGKYVVQFLLDHSQDTSVKVICRDQTKMKSLLPKDYGDRLTIIERCILKCSTDELQEVTKDCSAVVSCLGHSPTIESIWGKEHRLLVSQTVKRLTSVMPKESKFVLMASEGCPAPGDNPRGWFDRYLLALIRWLVPPHVDNETACAHLWSSVQQPPEWVIVRPCDLVDALPPQPYVIHPRPTGALFRSGVVARAGVARFLADLVLDPQQWTQYKYQAPVIHGVPLETEKTK